MGGMVCVYKYVYETLAFMGMLVLYECALLVLLVAHILLCTKVEYL
jgi:hypothetical protein